MNNIHRKIKRPFFYIQFICLLSFFVTPSFSQSNEKVILSVTYLFKHRYDTTGESEPLKTEMVLDIGKNISRYRNAAIIAEQKKRKEQIQVASSTSLPKTFRGGPAITVRPFGIDTDELYQISDLQKFKKISTLGSNRYLITESLPNINWKILNETKQIGGYPCQKAMGTCGGRNYIVWFTTSLPVPFGPWKLNGLPGLILEASDEKSYISFDFIKIKMGEEIQNISTSSSDLIETSNRSFEKLKSLFVKNPIAALQAQLPPSSPDVIIFFRTIDGVTLSGDAAKQALKKEELKKINNPIEISNN
ncbi:MAG: GLPGLI family protein [Microcystis aeruginosa Ma_AC_P_19900807_S300]|nr:MAG: GLPGLI family protein [Microcystis aeruginosa Ma_AC_P_19900807_S300]